MKFELLPVENIDLADYKHDMQEAFQLGAAVWEENLDEEILPESHIDKSLNANESIAYKAVVDGQMCGGAIVVINGAHGHLDFLYVKSGIQSKGIGQQIWNHIESMHPEVELWETCTPYFDTRNIHFYINRCGFSAVEFYNPKHIDPNAPEGDDGKDMFFRFEKRMPKAKSEIDRLKAVVEKLRSENGCSWDRAQTHSSLKAACIEEAAEVVGGINILEDTGDAVNLREELGDLLLQVIFHSVIAEEEGLFTFEDVAKTVSDKMIRRHPHVFSGVKYASEEELHEAWAAIKKEEKKGREWEADFLESALNEASELIEKAKERKGFKNKTIEYYENNAENYVDSTANIDFSEMQDAFLSELKARASILDFGCGSGRDSLYFLQKGYNVTALDGSSALCMIAREKTGIPVVEMDFNDFDELDKYDGIWACSSILHLSKHELKNVLIHMEKALHSGGIIYSSFKYGDFSGMRNGRFFTDFTKDSFQDFISDMKELTVEKLWITKDVRPGRQDEKWLNIFLKTTRR